MSPEVALLSEVWDTVKEHISKKERVNVAESILRNFEENFDMSELNVYKHEFDSAMKTAILSSEDYQEDAEEEEDWDY